MEKLLAIGKDKKSKLFGATVSFELACFRCSVTWGALRKRRAKEREEGLGARSFLSSHFSLFSLAVFCKNLEETSCKLIQPKLSLAMLEGGRNSNQCLQHYMSFDENNK